MRVNPAFTRLWLVLASGYRPGRQGWGLRQDNFMFTQADSVEWTLRMSLTEPARVGQASALPGYGGPIHG